ncbi:biopolymer transporter ExbD [Roseivivax sediminis]|uniref:Biopolymer transport protein ExbD n=1 Tax=Roseivivax sediminis TaxID=936889 RepID=A0A1I1ZA37_9RHOB|nr:biopolymer transporter ExbD [Roseivivax sediminis]SFE28549.1 biopolymer transport protein ExbD [Roseivivax sediminis]
MPLRLPRRAPIRPDVSLAIVNIVLLLILFFLATGTLGTTQRPGVAPPVTAELPVETALRPILVVPGDGPPRLDGEPVTPGILGPRLAGAEVLHVLVPGEAPASDLLALLGEPGLGHLEIRLLTVRGSDGP